MSRSREYEKIMNPNVVREVLVPEWQYRVKSSEGRGKKTEQVVEYPHERTANEISAKHGFNVLEKIRTMLKLKQAENPNNPEIKFQVLDLGGGDGTLAREIRNDAFLKGKVKVFTTGLSKRAIKKEMKSNFESFGRTLGQKERHLHPDDIVANSIHLMKDFPEFDFIIDTFGQQFYETSGKFPMATDMTKLERYLQSVLKKLRPGGFASIYPLTIDVVREQKFLYDQMKEYLEKKFGCKIVVKPAESRGHYILQIEYERAKKQ